MVAAPFRTGTTTLTQGNVAHRFPSDISTDIFLAEDMALADY
jgi:hypothetical protein